MLTFFVPGPPVSKGRPRFVRKTGHTFTPAKTAAAEETIETIAAKAMAGRPLYNEALAVIIDAAFLWPKSISKRKKKDLRSKFKKTRPDQDNIAKIYCDAANGVVWADDALLSIVMCRKFYAEKPGTTVRVYSLESEFPSWPFVVGLADPALSEENLEVKQ